MIEAFYRFRQFGVTLYRNGTRNTKQLDDNNDRVDYDDMLCEKVVVVEKRYVIMSGRSTGGMPTS